MRPGDVRSLHRVLGNRAVSSLLRGARSPVVQARLRVGPVEQGRGRDRKSAELGEVRREQLEIDVAELDQVGPEAAAVR